MNLVELLQSIADAIRTKTKGTDKINAQDFPTAIANIKGGSGNATPADVISGKTFSNDSGEQTGTMANNGSQVETITTKAQSVSIKNGFHDGSGKVSINSTEQAKIIADNILSGVTILGVTGTRPNVYIYDATAPAYGSTGTYTLPKSSPLLIFFIGKNDTRTSVYSWFANTFATNGWSSAGVASNGYSQQNPMSVSGTTLTIYNDLVTGGAKVGKLIIIYSYE